MKGLCQNCLGCNRLELDNFEGVTECDYYTSEQLQICDKNEEKDCKNVIVSNLSIAEIEIMHIIWRKEQVTSFDILENIKNISENSVRTLLARMVRKKAIYISEKNGKTYTYKSLIDRDEFLKVITEIFMDKIFQNDVNKLKNILEDL